MLAQGTREAPKGKQDGQRGTYAARAVWMLERAVALGYSTERLQSEAGAGGPFYPLRDEPGLRKLLATSDPGSR